ncbi:MAG: NIL domain-containing protein [Candidatus Methylomirabilia bacterium]
MSRMRVRLTFPPERVQEPIIHQLAKEFEIVTNIRRADVGADYGWVALELEGKEENLERGIAWLTEKGVKVDPIERDIIA